MLKTLYNLDLNQCQTLCKNQLVDTYRKSNYLQVVSRQNTSTPGVKTCTSFQVYTNVTYELRVEGVACRDNMAFLWVMDETKARLFTQYTFLPTLQKDVRTLLFKPTRCGKVHVGVLMTQPNVGDTFYIFSLKLSEHSSHGEATCSTTTTSCVTPAATTCYDYTVTTQNYASVCNTIQNLQPTTASTSSSLACHTPTVAPVFTHCEPLYTSYDSLLQLSKCLYSDNIKFNTRIPAGYTFLLQFALNDLTFRASNGYTFNLDSLYGQDEPYFFASHKFLINKYHDVNRNKKGVAIIPDARNDSNYFVCQIHLLFQLFHNKLVKKYKSIKSDVYAFVKAEVCMYYQWILLNDILPKFVDHDILEAIKCNGTKFLNATSLSVPAEFLNAASRLTQFSLKKTYKVAKDLIIDTADIYSYVKGKLPQYIIDWNLFFHLTSAHTPQPSKALDTCITKSVEKLPTSSSSQPRILSDLLAGQEKNICSGQNIAQCMEVQVLPSDIVQQFDSKKTLERHGVLNHTPLLLYTMLESQVYADGEYLTGVGGIVFAETIFSLLLNDKSSILNTDWKPSIGKSGYFSMADLIKFVYSDC